MTDVLANTKLPLNLHVQKSCSQKSVLRYFLNFLPNITLALIIIPIKYLGTISKFFTFGCSDD